MTNDAGGKTMTIRMPDEGSLQTVKTILAYESTVRGRKPGQTLSELVMEAVDIDSYPEEVKARLREIGDEISRRSVERFLNLGK